MHTGRRRTLRALALALCMALGAPGGALADEPANGPALVAVPVESVDSLPDGPGGLAAPPAAAASPSIGSTPPAAPAASSRITESGLPVPNVSVQVLGGPWVTIERAATFRASVFPIPDGGTISVLVDGTPVTEFAADTVDGTADHAWVVDRPIGSHTMSAAFSGTATLGAATSGESPLSIYGKGLTTFRVSTTDATTVARNTPIHYTATLAPNPGGGSVAWYLDDLLMETDAVLDGEIAFDPPTTTPYTHYLRAVFSGFGNWAEYAAPQVQFYVRPDPTTTELEAPATAHVGTDVVLTARITPNPGGGTVSWIQTGGYAAISAPVDADGYARHTITAGAPTTVTWTAHFDGHSFFGSSVSPAVSVTFTREAGVTLTADRATATVGEKPVTLQATAVFPASPPAWAPGTVIFRDVVDGVVEDLGPVAVDATTFGASYSSSALRIGVHTITALYDAPPGYDDATSAPVTVTIAPDTAPTTSLALQYTTIYPVADGYRDSVAVRGQAAERLRITVRIYDSANRLKRTTAAIWKNAGSWSIVWDGKDSRKKVVPAGRYTVATTLVDTRGNTATIRKSITVSSRKVTWKTGTPVVVKGSKLTFFTIEGEPAGKLYKSPDYTGGIVMDAGCEGCGWIGGRAVFSMPGVAWRKVYVQVKGHGFADRDPGATLVEHPDTADLVDYSPNCLYDERGVTCGHPVSAAYVSSTIRKLRFWIVMRPERADAYDLAWLKLTYQYAVLN